MFESFCQLLIELDIHPSGTYRKLSLLQPLIFSFGLQRAKLVQLRCEQYWHFQLRKWISIQGIDWTPASFFRSSPTVFNISRESASSDTARESPIAPTNAHHRRVATAVLSRMTSSGRNS